MHKNLTVASRLSMPLKVNVIDTDLSATYDFLLAFISNHESTPCFIKTTPT